MNTPARILLYINHIFIKLKEKKIELIELVLSPPLWFPKICPVSNCHTQTIGAYNKELILI